MVAVAGIHFGNTNSVITVSNESKLDTVSNDTGDRVTPTIVAYTGAEKVVGKPAKQFIIRNPLSCIANIKAAFGNGFTDVGLAAMKNTFSCEVIPKNGNSPAAEGLSDADLKKREKALMEKKAKLKNPNYFIS